MRPFLMMAMSVCLAMSVVAQTHRVDAVNPTEIGEFPGGRGRNALIIYTPDWGQPTTTTNDYGSEAVVIDGLVTEVRGNDNMIPENGFIVSGNGTARSWIVENLTPGTMVDFDETTIWVDHTITAERDSLLWRLEEVEERLAAFSGTEVEVADAVDARDEAVGIVDPIPPLAARLDALEAAALGLELDAMDSPPNEVRSVWYRLISASPEEIANDVAAFEAAHINAVFAEVNFGSSVAYPDPTGLFPQLAHQQGMDPLAILIDECHARGIEVHAWVHNFFLGFDRDGTNPPARFAEAHPEWVSVNRRGENELVPYGLHYFNPANLEFQDVLIANHVALVENYDLDGYHCDHIRYCLSMSWESGWDYSDYTRNRVREELGFDPLDITPGDNPDEWAQWLDWRQEQITSYFERQANAIHTARPGILISAAVFPDLEAAIEEKGQNWAKWVEEGWLDLPIPMIYTPSTEDVVSATEELIRHSPPDGPIVMGLGPFLGFTPRLLAEQVAASRDAGATGQCLFIWDMMTDEMIDALLRGPWRSTGPAAWDR